jgi:hypothetical protein
VTAIRYSLGGFDRAFLFYCLIILKQLEIISIVVPSCQKNKKRNFEKFPKTSPLPTPAQVRNSRRGPKHFDITGFMLEFFITHSVESLCGTERIKMAHVELFLLHKKEPIDIFKSLTVINRCDK